MPTSTVTGGCLITAALTCTRSGQNRDEHSEAEAAQVGQHGGRCSGVPVDPGLRLGLFVVNHDKEN